MNPSDFSSSHASFDRLLNRLFGQTDNAGGHADPLQERPHLESVGSGLESLTDHAAQALDKHLDATRHIALTAGVITDKQSAD